MKILMIGQGILFVIAVPDKVVGRGRRRFDLMFRIASVLIAGFYMYGCPCRHHYLRLRFPRPLDVDQLRGLGYGFHRPCSLVEVDE